MAKRIDGQRLAFETVKSIVSDKNLKRDLAEIEEFEFYLQQLDVANFNKLAIFWDENAAEQGNSDHLFEIFYQRWRA